MVDVKLDPETIENLKNAFQPIVTFDFLGIMKSDYNLPVEPIKDSSAADQPPASARVLSQLDTLDERYLEVGIHDMYYKNIFMHLAILVLTLMVMCVLKLIVAANTAVSSNDNLVDNIIKSTKKNDNGQDGITIKLEANEKRKESVMITKMRSAYLYLRMTGFLNIARLIYPQLYFLSFLFIRYYKKEASIMNILVPIFFAFLGLVLISQLFMIGSYKLVGDKNYGDKVKLENIALKKKEEEEKEILQESLKKKTGGSQQPATAVPKTFEKKLGSNQPNNNTKKADQNAGNLDDSSLAGLIKSHQDRGVDAKTQVKQELKIEKDYQLAFDDKDKQREEIIKLKRLKISSVDYEQEIHSYNPIFNLFYKDLKFDLMIVRLYPFFETLGQAMFLLVLVTMDSSPVFQTVLMVCLQIAIVIFISKKKPYILNSDNLRVMIDKALTLLVCLFFFIFALDKSVTFVSRYSRYRLLERGFLMYVLFAKVMICFLWIGHRIFTTARKKYLEEKKKKEETEATKQKASENLKRQKIQNKVSHLNPQVERDTGNQTKDDVQRAINQVRGQESFGPMMPVILSKSKMSSRRRRKEERKAEQNLQESNNPTRRRKRPLDERKEDVVIEDLDIKF